MHDASLVHVRHGVGDLPEGSPHGLLVEEDPFREIFAEESLEVSARGPLEDDAELRFVEEGVVHLHDARVPQVAQELHLAQASEALPFAHLVQVHLLDGDRRPVASARALVHHGVPALAHRPPDLVHLPKLAHGPALDRGELQGGTPRRVRGAGDGVNSAWRLRIGHLRRRRVPVPAGLALASHHGSVAIVSKSWLIQTLNVLRTPHPRGTRAVEDARTAM